MPASGISIATSSGVSMLSWSELSVHGANPLQPVDSQAPAPLGPAAALLAQSDASGLGQLSRAELQEMALLYRQVAADLSVLRQDAHRPHLCAACKSVAGSRPPYHLFRPQDQSAAPLFRFLRDEYPAIFQRQIGFVLASLARLRGLGPARRGRSPARARSSCATSSVRR